MRIVKFNFMMEKSSKMRFHKANKPKSLKYAALRGFLPLTLALWFPVSSYGLEGHFKAATFLQDSENFSTQANDAHSNLALAFADLRLKQQAHWQQWSFAVDYQLQTSFGKTLQQAFALNPNFAEFDQQQLFNLTDVIQLEHQQNSTHLAYQRIDRLTATYSAIDYSVTLGRQALSWGNGITFNPLDPFNSFAPNQFDREYKRGLDMLTAQKVLASGNEFSGFVLPRRNVTSNSLTFEDSSAGFKLTQYGALDQQWFFAKDAQELLAGIQLTGDWQDGLWNLDIIGSYDQEFQRAFVSGIANYQRAFSILNHSSLGFLELYFNGYGITNSHPTLNQLPDYLISKQASGKTFMSNQWYLASGLTIQATALLQIIPSVLINLQDQSLLTTLNGSFSLSNQDYLSFGVQVSHGETGSEFDGFTNQNNRQTSAYSDQLYLQWARYF